MEITFWGDKLTTTDVQADCRKAEASTCMFLQWTKKMNRDCTEKYMTNLAFCLHSPEVVKIQWAWGTT